MSKLQDTKDRLIASALDRAVRERLQEMWDEGALDIPKFVDYKIPREAPCLTCGNPTTKFWKVGPWLWRGMLVRADAAPTAEDIYNAPLCNEECFKAYLKWSEENPIAIG